MKNIFKKRIISLVIFCILVSGSLFAQTSIALNAGSVSSIFFYDQNGVLIRNIDSSRITFDKTLIIKSGSSKSVFTYKYGKIVLSKKSILAINYNQSNFTFYLVDGSVDISANQSATDRVSLITPVTKYILDSDSDIMATSDDNNESFGINKGMVTVYDSISGKKYRVHENNKMNLNSSEMIAYTDLEKLDSRDTFAQMQFPLGIKPVVKSNDSEDFYNLNIIATGNGEGNYGDLDFASLKGLLNVANQYNDKYLLIDAGNTLAGSVYVNFDKGESATKLLDKIGYDVFVPGARDFSYGEDQLKKLNSESKVNFISSNALDSNLYNILPPYQLYAFNDLRIAIFGLSSPSDLTTLYGLDFSNDFIINNAQMAIDQAREVADYVILVSNYNKDGINSNVIADKIKGIDLIIDGSKSLAYTTNRNDTLLVSTGVGYSKIIDTKLSVYKNNIISTTPSIIHSTNVNPKTQNNLSSALEIKSFERDESIDDFISTIKISDNYSIFLTPPSQENMRYTISANAPKAPSFTTFSVREQKVAKINTSAAPLVEEKTVLSAPPVATSTIKPMKTAEIKSTVVVEKVEEPYTKIESVENTVSDKPMYQEIQTNEENDSKISFGLKTEFDTDLIFNNFDFDLTTPIESTITLIPFFNSPNFSLGLNFNMLLDSGEPVYNAYPYPSTTDFENLYPYYMNMLEYLNINSTSGLANIDIEKGKFDSPVESALVHRNLGADSTLALNANYETANSNTSIFLSDATLAPYFDSEILDTGLLRTSSLSNNMFALTYGTLAKIDENNVNLYPMISSKINFIYNANLEVGLNLNGALYLPVSPFDLTRVIDNSGNSLFPNYIAGASLNFRFNKFSISAGANYEEHETDVTDFSTNIFHSEFNRSDLFKTNDTKTVSPNASISYENDSTEFHLSYSLPFDFDTMEIDNDLLDTSLSIDAGDFSYGLYYIQVNVIDHIQNYSSLKDFFYNDEVEYGLSLGYSLHDYLNSTLSLGLPDDTSAPLKLSLNVQWILDKNI